MAWAIRERIKGKALSTLRGGGAARAAWHPGRKDRRDDALADDDRAAGVWLPGQPGRAGARRARRTDRRRMGDIVSPEEWEAVCATFGAGSTYLARGTGAPRMTGVPKTVKYLASALLKCGKRVEHDGATRICNGSLMARGAEKYGDRNWEKADGPEELSRAKASALRHMMQWVCGEEDEDHAATVLFNIMEAEYVKYLMRARRRQVVT